VILIITMLPHKSLDVRAQVISKGIMRRFKAVDSVEKVGLFQLK